MDNETISEEQLSDERTPDEKTGVSFMSHIKITYPNTKEVLVQMRAD